MRFETLALHGGKTAEEPTGAIKFPIYQTSTFGQGEAGCPNEFDGRSLSYARTENPTRTQLEKKIAELEGAKYGVAFASGLAAIDAVVKTLATGDRVVACQDLYGGTYRMLTKVYQDFGVKADFVDTSDLAALELSLSGQPQTKLVWLESPSNPLLRITDIAAVSRIAKNYGAMVVVDNTFASPYLQQPLVLGADLVVHSTTKYLGGHGDVIGGVVVTNDNELRRRVKFIQNATGAIPGPWDCFLVLRGIDTLAIRMREHCRNASVIADFLSRHAKVERVYYPGLPTHSGYEIACRQMKLPGGMVSFVLRADVETSRKFLERLTHSEDPESPKLFTLAESLGATKSLISHPPSMTHASVEPEVRRRTGIADGLIRISVGIEAVEDLLEDLEQALGGV